MSYLTDMIHANKKINNYLDDFSNVAANDSDKVYSHRWNHTEQYEIAPVPLVIAGPSGSGKSTLLKRLMNEFQEFFGFSISHTTRQPRNGEQHGREYYFVNTDCFDDCVRNEEFIEYTRFSNNYYGTSKKAVIDVQKSGKICILDVEMDGVKNLKKTNLNPRFVFIKPPNLEALEERLRGRGTETEESLRRRLDRAIDELRFGQIEGMFDLIITNDDIDQAYSILREFVVEDVEALKKSRGM
ncbi:Guanylate kinase [Sarcoptes scabiei]|nr:Guanylate kinase [Sarcoptes scabiei]